jgi:hypothetical protein
MIKKLFLALAILFILIQFIHPARNESNDQTYSMDKKYPMPEGLSKTLSVACYDCHSNNTRYPWYFKIQPAAWFMASHVNDAKRHLNFSDYTTKRIAIQNHRFQEIIDEVKKGDMPLTSYTLIHRDAVITDTQKQEIIDWATAQMDSIKSKYPADSLILPKRPGAPGK